MLGFFEPSLRGFIQLQRFIRLILDDRAFPEASEEGKTRITRRQTKNLGILGIDGVMRNYVNSAKEISATIDDHHIGLFDCFHFNGGVAGVV